MEILTSEQMYTVEKLVDFDGTSIEALMLQAGKALSKAIIQAEPDKTKKIAVLCGKGNNGGDAIVVADLLQQQGYDVTLYLALGIPSSTLARKMLKTYLDHEGNVCNLQTCSPTEIKDMLQSHLFIDGIFGIGFSGVVSEELRALFDLIHATKAKVYAIDIPSGIDADTGKGAKQSLPATTTFSLGAFKPAHVSKKLQPILGTVHLLNIGIPQELIQKIAEPVYTFTATEFYDLLKPRQLASYKGTYGKLLCYCGQNAMMGAAILATKAAYRTGVGMVYTAIPEQTTNVLANAIPEAIALPLISNHNHNDSIFNLKALAQQVPLMSAVLIGCGLSEAEETQKVVLELISTVNKPLILDAAALNIIAQNKTILREKVGKQIIITPHFGEMARLIGKDVAYVQKHRFAIAKYFAQEYQIVVVLKGVQTIVATPEGAIYLHTKGNAGLAKAGSGDALAGTIAAFVAQGYPLIRAANMGVCLHGMAADSVAQNKSMHAMLISDIIEAYGNVLK